MLERQIGLENNESLLFFFSASYSFPRLLMGIEDMHFIWHAVAVLCLIQEYENYFINVHYYHYYEGFQLIWSVSLLGRVDTGYRACAWRILNCEKSGIIFWFCFFYSLVHGSSSSSWRQQEMLLPDSTDWNSGLWTSVKKTTIVS